MNFLSKLFGKKEKKSIEIKEQIGYEDDGFDKCGLCKTSIFPNTPRKTFPKSGLERKIYHIKCWRKLRKMGSTYQSTGKVMEI